MKTPDDFALAINSRKAKGTAAGKPGKPPSIIATLVLAGVILVTSIMALWQMVAMAAWALGHQGTAVSWLGFFFLQLLITGLALAAIIACLMRPAWGRAVCIAFGVYLALRLGLSLAYPSATPVFTIEPGAEQVGAYIGKALMVVAMARYLWALVKGARARAYFGAREVPGV